MYDNLTDKKIKAIVFDLYGTLIKYGDMPQAWKNWEKYCFGYWKRLGYLGNISDFQIINDSFFSKMPEKSLDPKLNRYEYSMMLNAKKASINLSRKQIKEISDKSCEVWQEEMRLDTDAIRVLSSLKAKYKLGMITNYDHSSHINNVLETYKLYDFFDDVIISGDTDFKKPNREIFELAAANLNEPIVNCVYVGDDVKRDALGSLSSGMAAILLKTSLGQDRLEVDYKADLKRGLISKVDNYQQADKLLDDLLIVNSLDKILDYL